MGTSSSSLAAAKKQIDDTPTVEGHYVSDAKTGYRWATDPIVSDQSIVKKPLPLSIPGLPGEVWGPYPKQFTKSMFGQSIFTPPESVDGVPILCRCREINQYIRSPEGGRIVNGMIALGLGASPPACWEDDQSIMNPYGGMTFRVETRNPAFYTYMASSQGGFGVAKGLANMLTGGARKNKTYKFPRRFSESYCKKTPCKDMGFTQRASCRPYKNCYTQKKRKSPQ